MYIHICVYIYIYVYRFGVYCTRIRPHSGVQPGAFQGDFHGKGLDFHAHDHGGRVGAADLRLHCCRAPKLLSVYMYTYVYIHIYIYREIYTYICGCIRDVFTYRPHQLPIRSWGRFEVSLYQEYCNISLAIIAASTRHELLSIFLLSPGDMDLTYEVLYGP